jgi:hypothetical protein
MASPGKRQPTLPLRVGRTTYPVTKTSLLGRLLLFQNDPSLLGQKEYVVKSDVPPPVFEEFVRIVESGAISVTRDNCQFFKALAEEFGDEELLRECNVFEAAREAVAGRTPESALAALVSRVTELEEWTVEQQRKMPQFEHKMPALEDQVRHAAQKFGEFDGVLKKQTELFEAEQAYRRGCEYFFGMNGFGVRGEELAKAQGLGLLKQAADLGHSDAQVRYGLCLIAGNGCAKDEKTGLGYLKKAADQGNELAKAELESRQRRR